MTVIIFILGRTETISGNIAYIAVTLLIILWICISRVIRDKQEASLPEITEEAILTEKTQDNRHSHSEYFLTFEIKNGERLTFQVNLETYSILHKGEKGILKYKRVSCKNSYMSLRFSEFERL